MDFDYDHETYWPALNDMCRQRREDKLARWQAAGSHVGELEEYLAGGVDESVSGFKFASPAVEGEKKTAEQSDISVVQEKLAEATLADEGKEAQIKPTEAVA